MSEAFTMCVVFSGGIPPIPLLVGTRRILPLQH
jgi:hypothetical protein